MTPPIKLLLCNLDDTLVKAWTTESLPGVRQRLLALQSQGLPVVVVTNQGGVGYRYAYPQMAQYEAMLHDLTPSEVIHRLTAGADPFRLQALYAGWYLSAGGPGMITGIARYWAIEPRDLVPAQGRERGLRERGPIPGRPRCRHFGSSVSRPRKSWDYPQWRRPTGWPSFRNRIGQGCILSSAMPGWRWACLNCSASRPPGPDLASRRSIRPWCDRHWPANASPFPPI